MTRKTCHSHATISPPFVLILRKSLVKSIKYFLLLGIGIILAACGGQKTEQLTQESALFAPPISSASITNTQSFPGLREAYSIKNTGSGFIVTENVTAKTSIIATSITSLRFSDSTVNLTVAKKIKTTTEKNVQQILELYVAFFNRVPDADGLVYWIDQVAAGTSITTIAESFYSAALQYSSITGYTTSMTNADFIKIVYKNALGRSSVDESGMSYWSSSLATGKESRGSLVVTIINSAHTFKGDTTYGYVADLLDNKLVVANYFAVMHGLSYNTPSESITKGIEIATAVTATDTTFAKSLVKIGVDATNSIFTPFPEVQNGGVTAEFIDMVKNASCANLRNRLFLIDQKQVFWDRAGSCPDAAHTQTLFGNNTKTVLCTGGDSLTGTKVMCEDESARTLFLGLIANRDKADLGLGSGHQVQQFSVPAGASFPLAINSYYSKGNFSTSTTQREYVIKDEATWKNFWSTVGSVPEPDVLSGLNFATQMAVGLFTSSSNTGVCSGVGILKANSNGQKLNLEYIESKNHGNGGACSAGWTNNTHMNLITLERNDLELEFIDVSDKVVKIDRIDTWDAWGEDTTSGITTTQNHVVRDQTAWIKLWSEHSTNNSNPGGRAVIDFSQDMVVALFSNNSCDILWGLTVWHSEGRLNVGHPENVNDPASPCTIRRSAYIARVPRFDGPVDFITMPTQRR